MSRLQRFDLDKHLAEEHRLSPVSAYLKEIVYGGNDGIVTTFAVVAGFAGAQGQNIGTLPIIVVFLFGFANLFADGVSMALGNFLSTRSEQDVYHDAKKKEDHEIHFNPRSEKEESIEILIRKGFSEKQAHQLVDIYSTNKKYWLEFMMNQELELSSPEKDNSTRMAIATFVSFIFFGMIPLIPYIFFQGNNNVFMFSVAATFTALLILGIIRWKITGHRWVRTIGETLLLGGTAAIVAYVVGTLFKV